MTSQNPIFQNEKFYHVANFGIEQRLVFTDERDIKRFLDLLEYYRIKNPPQRFAFRNRQLPEGTQTDNTPQIEILAYVLMPDHVHLLLQQLTDGGVQNFVSKVINAYTKFFNAKQKRRGTLFTGPFQAVEISYENLPSVSRHIHADPKLKNIITDLHTFPYSSFPQYLGQEGFVAKKTIMANYLKADDYKSFVTNEAEYNDNYPKIKNLLFD